MASRRSQRWTVVTSRLRYAAISFQELRRSAMVRSGSVELAIGSGIVDSERAEFRSRQAARL